jgi:hypothetical protein
VSTRGQGAPAAERMVTAPERIRRRTGEQAYVAPYWTRITFD